MLPLPKTNIVSSNNRNLQTSREPPNFQGRKSVRTSGYPRYPQQNPAITPQIQIPLYFWPVTPMSLQLGAQTQLQEDCRCDARPRAGIGGWVLFFSLGSFGVAFFVKRNYPWTPKAHGKMWKNEGILHPPKMCVFFNNEGGEFPWLVVV